MQDGQRQGKGKEKEEKGKMRGDGKESHSFLYPCQLKAMAKGHLSLASHSTQRKCFFLSFFRSFFTFSSFSFKLAACAYSFLFSFLLFNIPSSTPTPTPHSTQRSHFFFFSFLFFIISLSSSFLCFSFPSLLPPPSFALALFPLASGGCPLLVNTLTRTLDALTSVSFTSSSSISHSFIHIKQYAHSHISPTHTHKSS
ncbi:MAG: hypothetical protein J3R72DRAFT_90952 [Linnemannia gamsii]|nr:MAG: hypothetical protein J3R72DRAFT_90952 [Linnemannia gamsii]